MLGGDDGRLRHVRTSSFFSSVTRTPSARFGQRTSILALCTIFSSATGIAACSSSSEPSNGQPSSAEHGDDGDDVAGDDARDEPSDRDAGEPSSKEAGADAPDRPDPQPTVRDCGRNGTTGSKVSTHFAAISTYPTKLGAALVLQKPTSTLWAVGTPTRMNGGIRSGAAAAADNSIAAMRQAMLIPPIANKGKGEQSNFVDDDGPTLNLLAPSTTFLTYSDVWGQEVLPWSFVDPQRTASTSSNGQNLWVSVLVGHRFFAVQMSLLMGNDCVVGALSDALQGKATVTGATRNSGIFDPLLMKAAQDVPVKNEAKILVKVISHKPNASAESLLSGSAGPWSSTPAQFVSRIPEPSAPSSMPKVTNGSIGAVPSRSATNIIASCSPCWA